jgi:ABC-2 type transport system permease protein
MGLLVLMPAVALAATGWGLLLTSLVKTPQQAGSLGAAVMLVFGVLGGSFGNLQLPAFLQSLGRITPNAWGIEGFSKLGNGGDVPAILPNVLALLAIAVLTFAIATVLFGRKGFVKQ